MKMMKTEEAVGHVLCHDITQIIRGVTKGPVFRKGHVITKEDIPVLLSVGKDHVYIWERTIPCSMKMKPRPSCAISAWGRICMAVSRKKGKSNSSPIATAS